MNEGPKATQPADATEGTEAPKSQTTAPFYRLAGMFIAAMVGLAILSHEVIPRLIEAEGMDMTAPSGLLILLYIAAYLCRRTRWALHLLAAMATFGATMFTLHFGVWLRDTFGVSDWTTGASFIPAIIGFAIWRYIALRQV